MKWTPIADPNPSAVADVQSALQIPEVIARLLVQRGISDYETAKDFFRPDFNHLHDPFLMRGMDKAVQRIQQALHTEESVMVYGDYDVDGTTAVALVYSYLREKTQAIKAYIPDRYEEGYGVSKKGIDTAKAAGISLIIALDCGIKAMKWVTYAKSLGIDFIIGDHHLPDTTLPEAVAILNPKQADCTYPYKELCGCGIGFKLIQALHHTENKPVQELRKYLDLVATATAADIVPLTGENRVLLFLGLKQMEEAPRVGLSFFLTHIKKPLQVSDLVFKIAPRINAAGRMQHGLTAVQLLTVDTKEAAQPKAHAIETYNAQRKEVEEQITHEALAQIEQERTDRCTSVVFQPNWHKGVVGIVASRLIEHHYRPTVVLAQSGELLAGSVRSVRGFDVHQALESCKSYLKQFGGHAFAAGVTLEHHQLDAFKDAFEKAVYDTISEDMKERSQLYDAEIQFDVITQKVYRILKQMAPFGPRNMTPVFKTSGCRDTGNSRAVGSDKSHLKLAVIDPNGTPMEGIGFGLAHHAEKIHQQKPFTLFYSIDENEFNGKVSLQLKVRDICFEE